MKTLVIIYWLLSLIGVLVALLTFIVSLTLDNGYDAGLALVIAIVVTGIFIICNSIVSKYYKDYERNN